MYSDSDFANLKVAVSFDFVRENLENELKQKEYYLRGNDPKIIKTDLEKDINQLKQILL